MGNSLFENILNNLLSAESCMKERRSRRSVTSLLSLVTASGVIVDIFHTSTVDYPNPHFLVIIQWYVSDAVCKSGYNVKDDGPGWSAATGLATSTWSVG